MEKYRNHKNNKNKIENIFVEKLENYNKIQSLNRSIWDMYSILLIFST